MKGGTVKYSYTNQRAQLEKMIRRYIVEELNKKEAKSLLRELNKQEPPVELEQFLCELHLALDIFFEGDAERNDNQITLKIPNGQKFRITAEFAE